jgi:hypothetical protein
MKRVSWWLFIVSILHKNISKSTKPKLTQFDFEFLNPFFFIFGVDGMICGCYKGVGNIFLG